MFLVQPEVSELLVLEAMVSDQGAPQQSSGGAASCSVLPAVGDESLHGSKTKHLYFRNSAPHNDLQIQHAPDNRDQKKQSKSL